MGASAGAGTGVGWAGGSGFTGSPYRESDYLHRIGVSEPGPRAVTQPARLSAATAETSAFRYTFGDPLPGRDRRVSLDTLTHKPRGRPAKRTVVPCDLTCVAVAYLPSNEARRIFRCSLASGTVDVEVADQANYVGSHGIHQQPRRAEPGHEGRRVHRQLGEDQVRLDAVELDAQAGNLRQAARQHRCSRGPPRAGPRGGPGRRGRPRRGSRPGASRPRAACGGVGPRRGTPRAGERRAHRSPSPLVKHTVVGRSAAGRYWRARRRQLGVEQPRAIEMTAAPRRPAATASAHTPGIHTEPPPRLWVFSRNSSRERGRWSSWPRDAAWTCAGGRMPAGRRRCAAARPTGQRWRRTRSGTRWLPASTITSSPVGSGRPGRAGCPACPMGRRARPPARAARRRASSRRTVGSSP